MAKTDFKTVDEYIAAFPDDVQEGLEAIRKTIREAVPGAEEVISYQIPAYKYKGWILYFSVYKNHYSIACPPPLTFFEVFSEELAPYESSKSTVKFPKEQPLPLELIGKIARFRARENEEREQQKKKK